MNTTGEILLYQPDETVRLEVRMDKETVWLTQNQMAELFQKDQSVIARHIANVFKEGEQDEISNMQILHNTISKFKPTKIYSLDVIISVGYRVKSQRGVLFRKWANAIIKDYLLKGYAIQQQIQNIENKLNIHSQEITTLQNQVRMFIKHSLPPIEGIFYQGQIFDAYVFVANLIKSAKNSIVLIDNYIDESVFTLLDKRNDDVSATIYTKTISKQLGLDVQKHNAQYKPIELKIVNAIHDRFLLIDNDVYHIGASLKDLGKKLFAFSKFETKANEILQFFLF